MKKKYVAKVYLWICRCASFISGLEWFHFQVFVTDGMEWKKRTRWCIRRTKRRWRRRWNSICKRSSSVWKHFFYFVFLSWWILRSLPTALFSLTVNYYVREKRRINIRHCATKQSLYHPNPTYVTNSFHFLLVESESIRFDDSQFAPSDRNARTSHTPEKAVNDWRKRIILSVSPSTWNPYLSLLRVYFLFHLTGFHLYVSCKFFVRHIIWHLFDKVAFISSWHLCRNGNIPISHVSHAKCLLLSFDISMIFFRHFARIARHSITHVTHKECGSISWLLSPTRKNTRIYIIWYDVCNAFQKKEYAQIRFLEFHSTNEQHANERNRLSLFAVKYSWYWNCVRK